MLKPPPPPKLLRREGLALYEPCILEVSMLVAGSLHKRQPQGTTKATLTRWYEANYPTLRVASVSATLRGYEVALVHRESGAASCT